MSIVLCLYGCVALFMDGFLLGLQASECKVGIRDILEAFFFSAIWPVTVTIYVSEKVYDAMKNRKDRKGNENDIQEIALQGFRAQAREGNV